MSAPSPKRIVRRPVPPLPEDFPEALHPVLAQIYASRDVRTARELQCGLDLLPSFESLGGIAEAVGLLAEALAEGQRILVIGDFDADGATSTALAVRALRAMGAPAVDFLVPNRFEYGYGLSPEIVDVARGLEPDVVVTVDNGISSTEGVAAAQAAGMRVIVTDHHLPGDTLPPADAIVNPNQPGDVFSGKSLAGVGVVFYVMLALRALLRKQGWFNSRGLQEANLGDLLDLVALGTVADVVPLDHINRILVAQGIARIRAGRAAPGIKALLEVAGRVENRVVPSDLGFAVGPRLNAAGRLHDMTVGIRCLLTDEPTEARALAGELDRLNQARRDIEAEMQEQALEALDSLWPKGRGDSSSAEPHSESGGGEMPFGLCLFDPDWHEGVIGILASRIKDRVHRPVIVLTEAEQGRVKGSARSIPALHIRDALNAVATRHRGLLLKFGGHAMAAGLTLRREDLERFRHAFDAEVRRQLTPDDLQGTLFTDGELPPAGVGMELAVLLRDGGPWGQRFPEPLFDGVFEVMEWRVLKERHLKMILRWRDADRRIEALAFNVDLSGWGGSRWLHVAYRLEVNEYRGERRLQLIVEHFVELSGGGEAVSPPNGPA